MPRRQGQIKELEPGKYKAIIFIGSVNGQNKYKSKTVKGTYKQAETVLHKMLVEREEYSPHAMARKPLEIYAKYYLDTLKQTKGVRENTLNKITSHMTSQILPTFGRRKLEQAYF